MASRKFAAAGVVAAGAALTLIGSVVPASAASAFGAWEAGDHGPGGWAGGVLWSNYLATGSGAIAGPGQLPAHITPSSWVAAGSKTVDVNFSVTFPNGQRAPGCVQLTVTRGPEVGAPLYIGGGCGAGKYEGTIPGKVTPLG
jgi:hypothetical protein